MNVPNDPFSSDGEVRTKDLMRNIDNSLIIISSYYPFDLDNFLC